MSLKDFNKYLELNKINPKQAKDFLQQLDGMVWINPALENHSKVEEYAISFVEALFDKIEETVPNHGLKLIKSGSYYSNLRVGRPYEFDFMLEIPTPKFTACEMNANNNFPVQFDCIDDFSTTSMKQDLYYLLEGGLSDLQKESDWNIVHYSDEDSFLYNPESPAVTILLKGQDCGIMIDLVPCFKYPKEFVQGLPALKPEILKYLSKCLKNDGKDAIGCTGEAENRELNLFKYFCGTDYFQEAEDLDAGVSEQRENKEQSKESALNVTVPEECKKKELCYLRQSGDEHNSDSVTGDSKKSDIEEMSDVSSASSQEDCIMKIPMLKCDTSKENKLAACCESYPEVLFFLEENLYLVFTNGYRLSTSKVENFMIKHGDQNMLAAFCIVKYLLQTYHIPIGSVSEHGELFGPKSCFSSRLFTLMFIDLIALSYTHEYFTENKDLLDWFSILWGTLERNEYLFIDKFAHGNLFVAKHKYEESMRWDNYFEEIGIHKVFEKSNLHTLGKFIFEAMKHNNLEIFYLTPKENGVLCPCCLESMHGWKINMKHAGFVYEERNFDSENDVPFFYRNMPSSMCYPHQYIGCKSVEKCPPSCILVYKRV